MEKMISELKNVTLDRVVQCFGLRLEPANEKVLVFPDEDKMPQKRFERQCNVLRGYIAVLSYGQVGMPHITADNIPKCEGEDAFFAVWFAKSGEGTASQRAMAIYNGFCTLCTEKAERQAMMTRFLGEDSALKLIEFVEMHRRADDDNNEDLLQIPIFTMQALEKMREGLFSAGQEKFSCKSSVV